MGEEDELMTDISAVNERIKDVVNVLNDFTKLRDPNVSRQEYVVYCLLKDICNYYGYSPFLAEMLFNLFPVSEAIAFFEANEVPRPVTIRTNTLRTRRRDLAQALINRGVNGTTWQVDQGRSSDFRFAGPDRCDTRVSCGSLHAPSSLFLPPGDGFGATAPRARVGHGICTRWKDNIYCGITKEHGHGVCQRFKQGPMQGFDCKSSSLGSQAGCSDQL